jgi:hypothetical protein
MNTNLEKPRFSLASLAIAAILLFCAITASGQDDPNVNLSAAEFESESDMIFMLLQIQADLQGSLNDLDSNVANAAQNLSATGLEGAAAREVLAKLLETNSNLSNAITINKDGRIIIA